MLLRTARFHHKHTSNHGRRSECWRRNADPPHAGGGCKLSETARNELEEKKKLAEKQLADEKKKHAEEMEQLRAELTKKEAAPPSPEKQTLSEADAEAVSKIEQRRLFTVSVSYK